MVSSADGRLDYTVQWFAQGRGGGGLDGSSGVAITVTWSGKVGRGDRVGLGVG